MPTRLGKAEESASDACQGRSATSIVAYRRAGVRRISCNPVRNRHGQPVGILHSARRTPDIPRMRHAFTVDVEDWQQSVFDHSAPVSERFVAPTYRIAELLERTGTRATFFVLGNIALKAKGLIADLARAGHEIQSHGYDHAEVHTMTPRSFRDDLLRTRDIIEAITGKAVQGYRAPRFSIDATNLWALDVLLDCGFIYDSSIFPMRIRGYGIDGWNNQPHRIRTPAGREIMELPVATGEICGRRFPMGGGGYFRLLPWPIISWQIHRMEAAGKSATIYCHPHEFDPDAFNELPLRVPLRIRLHQSLGRRSFARRIENLLTQFSFGPIRDLIRGTVITHAERSSISEPRTSVRADVPV